MSKYSLHKKRETMGRALRHCEARSSPDNQLKLWIASSFLLAMTRSGKSLAVKK
jgi:hypothetical protein